MRRSLLALAPVFLACLPAALVAETLEGAIQEISRNRSSLRIEVEGRSERVRFDHKTDFVNFRGIEELAPAEVICVELEPGEPASKVTRKIFVLPPALEIQAEDLQAQMDSGQNFLLVDARPSARYREGHLPGAISIFVDELPAKLSLLPEDKGKRVVFYCGGPTCPFTGRSIEIAQRSGYTNVRGFQAGIAGWRKSGRPVHASASWLAEHLDPHHVILDVRPRESSGESHIQRAVAMPAEGFKTMTRLFILAKQPPRLPGVADRLAPIILYGEGDRGEDVQSSYKWLTRWGYKDVAILEGGFDEWTRRGLPAEDGPAAAEIRYTRALKPGAIHREDFVKLEKDRQGVTFLDVRTPGETAGGAIEGALLIPLEGLEVRLGELPRKGEIITYCSNGVRSALAYSLLKDAGFERVRFLDEDMEIGPEGTYRFE